jgi:hypothetical protein
MSTKDIDSLERSLKLLPPEHVRLIEKALTRSGDVAKYPAPDDSTLERCLASLPDDQYRIIYGALEEAYRSAGKPNPEQDISEEFDALVDEIEREIDAGMHDGIDEHTVEVFSHRTLTRINRWMDQLDPIEAVMNEPSELVFGDDDDDESQDEDGDE